MNMHSINQQLYNIIRTTSYRNRTYEVYKADCLLAHPPTDFDRLRQCRLVSSLAANTHAAASEWMEGNSRSFTGAF